MTRTLQGHQELHKVFHRWKGSSVFQPVYILPFFYTDSKIQEVNRDYRNKNVSTDVITFALFADDDFKMVMEDDIYLGEILISVDTAKKQAKDGVKNEVSTLITHGILHLLGFDHQTEEDYNFIVNIQDRVLNLL